MTQLRSLPLALAATVFAFAFAFACGGDGEVLSAFPDEGFVGRTTTMVIVGEDTSFGASSSVDLGAAVTVDEVVPVGSSALMVTYTAAIDAAVGPRDVTVDGQTLAGGLTLASPIEVEVLGTTAQGSMLLVNVTNLDLLNPFDTTADEDGNPIGVGLELDAEGVGASLGSVSPDSVSMTLQVDVNAPPGDVIIDVVSGGAERVTSRLGVSIAERQATPLALGESLTGDFANPFDSALYVIDAEELAAFQISLPSGGQIAPVLGATGSFSDVIGVADLIFGLFPVPVSNIVEPGDTLYVIVWNVGGGPAVEYPLVNNALVAAESIANTDDGETRNDTFEDAQAVAVLPGGVTGGSFDSAEDEDWFAVTLPADDVPTLLTAVTGGRGGADPVLQIFALDAESETGLAPLTEAEDNAFFDRVTTDEPIEAAGTYYVKVSPSDFGGGPDPADSDYTLVLALEEAPPPEPEPEPGE
jgi:hypothetical protein